MSTSNVSVYDSVGARSTRSKKVSVVMPVAGSNVCVVGATLLPPIGDRPERRDAAADRGLDR